MSSARMRAYLIFSAVRTYVQELQPNIIVHCAALYGSGSAESDGDDAYAGNALAAGHVAAAAAECGAYLIAISTDYVFDGMQTRAYHEWDACSPRTVYSQKQNLLANKLFNN